MELLSCPNLAVPVDVMAHVVHIESSNNPYAIGVVGGRLVRQPRNLTEALATVRMLESQGYNFSIGLAQVNRYNLSQYGLDSYARAFEPCPNLQAGARILSECYSRSGGDWGKSFSCYYSGNFTTGYRHGYVQKIFASMRGRLPRDGIEPIAVMGGAPGARRPGSVVSRSLSSPATRRSSVSASMVEARNDAPIRPSVGPEDKGTPYVASLIAPAGARLLPSAPPQKFGESGDQAFVF